MNEAWSYTPLGWIKLIEENNLLITIRFIDDEIPEEIPEPTPFLDDCMKELQLYFQGQITDFSFIKSARQQGTAFQQKVWNELTSIPYGKTISYRQLALQLGDEKCIRAAASANGQNNIAIAVPCHRVIGTDGSLTGYAGGLWRKKWLLELEAINSGKPVQTAMGF